MFDPLTVQGISSVCVAPGACMAPQKPSGLKPLELSTRSEKLPVVRSCIDGTEIRPVSTP